MDVLEALEDETLESYSRSRGFECCAIRAHIHMQAKKPALHKQPPYLGVVFFMECVDVAKMLRIRWEGRNGSQLRSELESLGTHTMCKQNSLQNAHRFSAMFYRSVNGYSSQMPRSALPNGWASCLLLHNSPFADQKSTDTVPGL